MCGATRRRYATDAARAARRALDGDDDDDEDEEEEASERASARAGLSSRGFARRSVLSLMNPPRAYHVGNASDRVPLL